MALPRLLHYPISSLFKTDIICQWKSVLPATRSRSAENRPPLLGRAEKFIERCISTARFACFPDEVQKARIACLRCPTHVHLRKRRTP